MNGRRGFLARLLLAPVAATMSTQSVGGGAGRTLSGGGVRAPAPQPLADDPLNQKLDKLWEQFHHDRHVEDTYAFAAAEHVGSSFKAAPAWRKAAMTAEARVQIAETQHRERLAMRAKEAAMRSVGL